MLLLMDFLNEAPIETLFAETTGKPFGDKIKSFNAWCDLGAPAAQKAAMQAIYKDLDALLPKRNFIVHGETREGEFKGRPRQTYRVGLVKNNLEYLDEFDRGEHGPNIFRRVAGQGCEPELPEFRPFRYGHGLAADLVSVKGETRSERWSSSESLWKWIDAHGEEFGIGRPYLDRDPPHVAPINGKEYAAHRGVQRAGL